MLPLRAPFYPVNQFSGVRMSLEASDVEKIAYLARLGIDAGDIPEYTRNLSAILAFVEQLNAADTTGVEPLAHPLEATQRLRPDTVTEVDNRENFQRVAPQTEAGLYLVPKVIE
jgi:aspartyl-tRNA(Asn)/glutamyl-tRNA(Gln) amidotransferase subunit C